jgi:MTH538 TIR-like domain (DUF1863)
MIQGLIARNLIQRRVFISYHHAGDKAYYDAFSNAFSENYQVIQDNSVERAIDSNNAEYVIRKIREEYITGTSCTIVLCGAGTPWRKFVDWEIKATLDKEHALIGVNLPTNPITQNQKFTVPDRLHDNIESGYAVWVPWATFVASAQSVQQHIELANGKAKALIRNQRQLRGRNG